MGGAGLLVGTRIALWLGVQLLLAGLLALGGVTTTGRALDAAAGWWMVYGALVDLGTLGVIGWLLRRDGGSYRGLLGPPTPAWRVALGALGVLAASVPAMVFSGQLTSAVYGEAIPPMFAVVDLPPWPAPSACWWCRCLPSWPSRSPTWAWCCRGWSSAWAGHGWPAWLAGSRSCWGPSSPSRSSAAPGAARRACCSTPTPRARR